MKKNTIKVMLLTFFLLNSVFTLAQWNWTKYEGNPVMSGGGDGSWDKHVFEPMVLFNPDSSRFEMYYAGSYGLERPFRIGVAYSQDGIIWTPYQGNPVFVPTNGTWDESTVERPWVIRENGQYKMWYDGHSPGNTIIQIGYATSPDGINWTKHPDPVLQPGVAWDAGRVAAPSVIADTSGYTMYYAGADITVTKIEIGRAFSNDGINWWKDTVNNPVLKAGAPGEWDESSVSAPSCLYMNGILYLTYQNLRSPTQGVGQAFSTDNGLTWIKDTINNPIIESGDSGMWDEDRVEFPKVLLISDTLYMWYGGSKEPEDMNLWRIGLAKSPITNPLLPGTYSIGSGGYFPTIDSAFSKLNTDGIAGEVILELLDELYTAPTDSFGFKLTGPIPGAGPNSRVIIKPAANKNVTIEGSGRAVVSFLNTNYVTIDGVSLSGSTTLKIHTLPEDLFDEDFGMSFIHPSSNNIVQNVTFENENYTKGGRGISFRSFESITNSADSNLIQNNFIKKAGVGIEVAGWSTNAKARFNLIKGNNVGSETESLITWGIQVSRNENTIIENNVIQNIRTRANLGGGAAFGINLFGSAECVVRNNIVHNIDADDAQGPTAGTSSGIQISGLTGETGENNLVYNNMVYDVKTNSALSTAGVFGINIWYQNNPKIYFNSVYLYGGDRPSSSALNVRETGSVTNLDVKNNIFVNTRVESSGNPASAILNYSVDNFTSDYNNLFYQPNPDNSLVRINTTNYITLAEWQATGHDLKSVTELPNFIAPDLHINASVTTSLESSGTPISGIDTDFDGDTRDAETPDIGADEFSGIVDVEDEMVLPTEFALEQNYPNPFNPSTKIKYSVPQSSKVIIKVFDVLGKELAILINEEKPIGTYEINWNAANLPSGVYFYQIRAGTFVKTNKMILMK